MWAILSSEFFWGIVIGLLLSFVGGWALASFTVKLAQKSQKEVIRNFCIDTLQNLQAIILEMDVTYTRTKAIHHDFLSLMDVEIAIYGRNREHLIHLPLSVRTDFRKFMNECAIQRAQIISQLEHFYRIHNLAQQIAAEGRAPEAERLNNQAFAPLSEACRASHRLVAIANSANELLAQLKQL